MARHTRFHRHVLESPQAGEQTRRWMDNISLQVLPLRVSRIRRFLLPTGSFVSCLELV
jgi:hypothetical protein